MARGREGKRVILFGVVLVLLIVYYISSLFGKVERYAYKRQETIPDNPFIGFAPSADYIEAVGDNRLVYVDVTWKELEPEEGIFDFSSIYEQNYLKKWRSEGKNVVFRFVCDMPSAQEHMDIPLWLYEKTQDGTFYDTAYGKGYAPDYGNKELIRCHRAAIEALGKEFGGDTFFCYIELGSVGHWGEWHVKYDEGIRKLPGWEILKEYVAPYKDAFPNAKLLMRRPFPAVSEDGFGVYNDMTGDAKSTGEWLSWISGGDVYTEAGKDIELPACPEVWKTAPVGGEFTSSIPMEEMLVGKKERTLALLEKSHMSFIGPKCPIACDEEEKYPEEVEAIRGKLGYCYGVSEAVIAYSKISGKMQLTCRLCNYGTAPIYFDWPFYVYVLDEAGNISKRYETGIKPADIAAGCDSMVRMELTFDKEQYHNIPKIAVGIENPVTGKPAVKLDMDVREYGLKYLLNEDIKE